MSEMKPTPGPLRVETDGKWPFHIRTFDAAGDCVFCEDMPTYSTAQRSLAECLAGAHMSGDAERSARANAVALANAELRAEAHNVLTTTGLTPRQLVERVKELEGIVRAGHSDIDGLPSGDLLAAANVLRNNGHTGLAERLESKHEYASAALSKSLPNTVAETPK